MAEKATLMTLFLTFFCLVNVQGTDDVKAILTSLDTKIEGLKEKLQSLNFMEYAFKMTNFDNTLKTISTNVELITKKVTDIEKKVADITAGKITVTGRSEGNPQTQQPQPTGGSDSAFQKKMEEYGEKMLSVQHSLVSEVKGHSQLSGGVKTLLENGLNKMFVKLDSLLGLQATGTSFQQVVESIAEIRNTILSTIVGSNSTTRKIDEMYSALKGDFSGIQKDIKNISKTMEDFSRLNNVTEMVQGARIEEAGAVIAKLRKDLSELNNGEPLISQAENAVTQISNLNPEKIQQHEMKALTTNLTNTLSNYKQLSFPLLSAIDGGFQMLMDIMDKNVSVGRSKTLPFMCGGLRFLSMDVSKMERSLNHRLQTIQNSFQCSAGSRQTESSVTSSSTTSAP